MQKWKASIILKRKYIHHCRCVVSDIANIVSLINADNIFTTIEFFHHVSQPVIRIFPPTDPTNTDTQYSGSPAPSGTTRGVFTLRPPCFPFFATSSQLPVFPRLLSEILKARNSPLKMILVSYILSAWDLYSTPASALRRLNSQFNRAVPGAILPQVLKRRGKWARTCYAWLPLLSSSFSRFSNKT